MSHDPSEFPEKTTSTDTLSPESPPGEPEPDRLEDRVDSTRSATDGDELGNDAGFVDKNTEPDERRAELGIEKDADSFRFELKAPERLFIIIVVALTILVFLYLSVK